MILLPFFEVYFINMVRIRLNYMNNVENSTEEQL